MATNEKPLLLDPDTARMRIRHVVPIVVSTAALVAFFMRFEYRMGTIEHAMDRDISNRSGERAELIQSVNGVRDEMRRVFVDSVATRQAQAWIELARALNRDRYPNLVWPDLPR